MIDYTILYKELLPPLSEAWTHTWELFISGYSLDQRVRDVFDKIAAGQKWWLVQPQYNFSTEEVDAIPTSNAVRIFADQSDDEAVFFRRFLDELGELPDSVSLCVDISGLMRPHLLFLVRVLFSIGITRFDVIYSEPAAYSQGAETQFAYGPAVVRQVAGFGGVHSTQTEHDLLIIGSGYDSDLIATAAYSKGHSRMLQMFGLPSLQPDMYPESRLRAKDAEGALGESAETAILVAPAHDPFVTASVLQEAVAGVRQQHDITNLYLCPVASKPQALGFGLFYVSELLNSPASLIYPFATRYTQETTNGIKNVWKYTVEKLHPT